MEDYTIGSDCVRTDSYFEYIVQRMASDRRDNQPTGSRFVGEIDHDEIKHIEVNPLLLVNTRRVFHSLSFLIIR